MINSAEVYNPELNQWEHMVARMLTPRVGPALVSMGNLIYVIGTPDNELREAIEGEEKLSYVFQVH